VIRGERYALPEMPVASAQHWLYNAPMSRVTQIARYSIRRNAFGWSVIDATTGLVVCRPASEELT
jgi:hypothetical protein